MNAPRVLVVVAHPDDETFGCGGLILDAVASGAQVTVVCATRGEAGESTVSGDLATVRETELREAGAQMGVGEVIVLDFADSGMDGPPAEGSLVQAPMDRVVASVAEVVDRLRPDVVITLDASDGHRDHAKIRDATLLAATEAGVPTIYLSCLSRSLMQRWMDRIAGIDPGKEHVRVEPTSLGTPDQQITTVIDVRRHAEAWERAMAQHVSQTSPYDGLDDELRHAFLDHARARRLHPGWRSGDPLESRLLL